MRAAIAWLLFFFLLAWSGLVGWLAGTGAMAVRRRVPDGAAVGLAAMLVFGLALAIGGRALRPAYVVAAAMGFALAVPAALRRESEETRGPFGADTASPGSGGAPPTGAI